MCYRTPLKMTKFAVIVSKQALDSFASATIHKFIHTLQATWSLCTNALYSKQQNRSSPQTLTSKFHFMITTHFQNDDIKGICKGNKASVSQKMQQICLKSAKIVKVLS